MEIIKIGNLYSPNFIGGNYGGNVYDMKGLAPAVKGRDYKDPTLVIVWK